MRFIKRDWNDKPAILTKQSTLDALTTLVSLPETTIKESIYRGTYKNKQNLTKSSVIDKLNIYYHHKCAYCETLSTPEVEHYRPKGSVEEETSHRGYYWLSYEWSNLLPACHDCNKRGSKGTRFPINGERVFMPPFNENGTIDFSKFKVDTEVLLNERPYLLHPEIDNPADFLSFEIDSKKDGIAIVGIDIEGERGNKTIEICQLNREPLKIARGKLIDNIVLTINLCLKILDLGEIGNIKKGLIELFKIEKEKSIDMTQEHILFRTLIMTNEEIFEQIIISQLEISQQAIVREAFKAYKNGTL